MKTSDRIKQYMKKEKKDELKKKPQFEVGEVAIIKKTEKKNSSRHGFKKGQRVTIQSIERVKKGEWFYIALGDFEDWAVMDEDLVKVK